MITDTARIPDFETRTAEDVPRALDAAAATPVRRRPLLKGALTGSMTLAVTVIGWIPLAKPARATVGTEYTANNCSDAGYSYDGKLCTGAPYSSGYCGSDKWFKNGCFRAPDNYVDCYAPTKICGSPARNAWRWSGYRCADGYYTPYGQSRLFRICSAKL